MWFKRFWRGQAHKWMNRWRMLAAFSALVGTGAAVWVNQMILRGEEPRSAIVDAFKALNTAASAVCTLAIYSAHWLEILNVRLNEHLSRGTKLDVDVTFRSVGAKSMLQGAQWLSSPVSETLPDDESLPDLDA